MHGVRCQCNGLFELKEVKEEKERHMDIQGIAKEQQQRMKQEREPN